MKQTTKALNLLTNISTILRAVKKAGSDIGAVIDEIVRITAREMELSGLSLTIFNRATDEIYIDCAFGMSNEEKEKGKYKVGEGITGKVVQTGQPIVVENIFEDSLFLNRTKSRHNQAGERLSYICVPVISEEEIVGTLNIEHPPRPRINLEDEAKLMAVIATMISQFFRLYQEYREERTLIEENKRLYNELKLKYQPKNMIGTSTGMMQVYNLIEKVSSLPVTVLILGESGVGKEGVARAIHFSSDRAEKPFIAVNCGSIPENLIESDLFGHEKGAFTGAVEQAKGKFESADGGTLFLDEVGELSLSAQTKLLRALQEREIQRVGGSNVIKTDVRVIAATNRNLEELIEEKKFRQDLYYRLHVFPVIVPPLRERKTDIPLLINYFVEKYSQAYNKMVTRVSTPAIDMLMSYHWPGNVRELENCIERVVVLCEDGIIHSYLLPPTLQTSPASDPQYRGTLQKVLDNVEYEFIIDALKKSKGNMAEAAKSLGITERMMGLRVRKYKIMTKYYRPT